MIDNNLQEVLASWVLPEGGTLQNRLERMIRPALFAGHFGRSFTIYVSGLQYHLGGAQDTRELASLAEISANDHVLDVCCFLGGPALQLAESYGCKVTGIDISEAAIAAANRMTELAELDSAVTFRVANAAELPYEGSSFTVVWNQCSLAHSEAWIREFDRVLCPGGRLAFTFQTAGKIKDISDPFSRWYLEDAVAIVEGFGYDVIHADDITRRDIEIGWSALDKRLTDELDEFTGFLGADWINDARQDFINCANEMRSGECGNGRIVAVKRG